MDTEKHTAVFWVLASALARQKRRDTAGCCAAYGCNSVQGGTYSRFDPLLTEQCEGPHCTFELLHW